MAADWLILHGGALGDLVLTIQLALRLPHVLREGRLHLLSRSNPGDLSAGRPSIMRQSAEGLGLTWLYGPDAAEPPDTLAKMVRGARVLSALGSADSTMHHRLGLLQPATLLSFDPRPRPGLHRHITRQWQTDLEEQGLLVPKCVHQHPDRRSLGVPESLRLHGGAVLRDAGSDAGCALIHPGSGGRTKCWPLAGFLTVGRELAARGAPVCVLLGPVEVEWCSEADLAALAREFPLLRLPSPDMLVAALAAARVVVANDSGPAHLAALLGTRTVTIFGPTSPALWRPLGADVHVVGGEPEPHPDDWGIPPERVVSLAAACW